MDILRFTTAGSVDDGKSTLIGRLLYNTDNIKADILNSVSINEDNSLNLAHITDGLRSEREQGITIDVAYKYFTTPKRKYIITDAPGHFQFTKNLVTGASNVDAVIILIDAANGITAQTKRHAMVASFLRIKNVVVAINKMDIVGFSKDRFLKLKKEYEQLATELKCGEITYIPISGLYGDNITTPSGKMDWYQGNTLLHFLETCQPNGHSKGEHSRFTVQYALNSQKDHKPVYAGKLLSGQLQKGQELIVYPQKEKVIVDKIYRDYEEIEKAEAGENICLSFTGNIPIKRGNMLTNVHYNTEFKNTFEAQVCWLTSDAVLQTNKEYIVRINAAEMKGRITEVIYETDAGTLQVNPNAGIIGVNQFAKVKIEIQEPLFFEQYSIFNETGRGILIDTTTYNTCAAFIID